MKHFGIVVIALAMMSTAAFAQDGSALYKANCAGCHKADGSGGMGPKIAGKSSADVLAVLSTGGKKAPHTGAFAKVTAAGDQKAIADFVATLK